MRRGVTRAGRRGAASVADAGAAQGRLGADAAGTV